MNAWLPQSSDPWQLAGWTMIHYLWIGGGIAIAGGLLRQMCRWASPNARYAASLLTLLVLAAAPAIIAAGLRQPSPSSLAAARSLEPLIAPFSPRAPRADRTTLPAPTVTIDLAQAAPHAAPSFPSTSQEGLYGQAAASATDVARQPARPANPSPRPALRGTRMLDAAAAYLPWLWLAGAPLTLCLLAAGLVGSERLRRHGTPITSGPAFDALERLGAACGLSRRVALAACDSIAQPVLIGILRPLILLPASALSGWTAAELEMVLIHELAHVRRWDNLVNLLQRVVESLLFFHPAVWLTSRQVRRDREECCDAAVVRRTDRPREYAELLVSIASALPRGRAPRLAGSPLGAASMMASHPLAGRIRRILKPQEEPMGITRRTLAALIALPLVATAITVYTAAAQEEKAPPTSKEGARGEISQPTESPNRNNGGIFATIYPVNDFVTMDWQQWVSLIKSDPRIDIRSAEDRQSVIINAPPEIHASIASLLSAARREYRNSPIVSTGAKGLQEVVIDFLPTIKDAAEMERIAMLLTAGGQPARVSTAAEPGGKERQVLLVTVPAEWRPKAVWESRTEGKVCRIIDGRNHQATAPAQTAPFPSLADQKIADLAYKHLALELEPINAEELARVQQLGYAGGLRIVASGGDPNHAENTPLAGDILVGLHAWPVNDLKSLETVLLRDDLDELNPLKFYVVRRDPLLGGADPFSSPAPLADKVITGRLRIAEAALRSRDLAAAKEQLSQLEALPGYAQPAFNPTLPPPGANPTLPSPSYSAPPMVQPPVVVPQPNAPIQLDPVWNASSAPATNSEAESRQYVAIGLLPPADSQPLAAEERERTFAQMLVLAKSPQVLQRAMAGPVLKDLPLAKSPEKFARLLAEQMRVSYPHDGEIMEFVLVGPYPKEVLEWIVRAFEAEARTSAPNVRVGVYDPNYSPYVSGDARSSKQQTTYLYDGKTFDQWRDSWRHELNAERRLEAVKALSAFARAGYGREAAAAILDVAAEYDFSVIDGGTPEGKTKEFVIQFLAGTSPPSAAQAPPADWLPALMQRLAADNAKWRPLADELFLQLSIRPEDDSERVAELLRIIASDPQYGPNATALVALVRLKGHDAAVQQLVRSALTGDDADNALRLLRHLGFMQLDVTPEQLNLLFHQDQVIRRKARSILSWIGPSIASQGDVKSPADQELLAILADPQQAAKHADALRALAAMFMNKSNFGNQSRAALYGQRRTLLATRLKEILLRGDESLIAPALAGASLIADTPPAELIKLEDGHGAITADVPPPRRAAIENAVAAVEAEIDELTDPQFLHQAFGINPSVPSSPGGGFF